MSHSKGKTTITLKAVIAGKKLTSSIDVRIRNSKSSRIANASDISRFKIWKEKLQANWYVFRAQMKYWWLSQKKWQKALWVALLVLWLAMMFSALGKKPDSGISSDQLQTAWIIR